MADIPPDPYPEPASNRLKRRRDESDPTSRKTLKVDRLELRFNEANAVASKVLDAPKVSEADYSDPKKLLKLPYPAVDMDARYEYNSEHNFLFQGRERFAELLEITKQLKSKQRPGLQNNLLVYGTMGSGKSHILGSLALHLMQTSGGLVIYIPSCYKWIRNPAATLSQALVVALGVAEPELCREIKDCKEDWEKLVGYLEKLDRAVLILDHWDSIVDDEKISNPDGKAAIFAAISKLSQSHLVIRGVSAEFKVPPLVDQQRIAICIERRDVQLGARGVA